jgi:hypothetical protein
MDYVSKRLAINLSKLHGARIIEQYDEDGYIEKGIFIPLDRNNLYEGKNKCVVIYAFLNYNNRYPDEESYQVIQSVDNTFAQKMKDLGYAKTVLGYLRDIKSKYVWRPRGEYIAQRIIESKEKKK